MAVTVRAEVFIRVTPLFRTERLIRCSGLTLSVVVTLTAVRKRLTILARLKDPELAGGNDFRFK